MTNTERIEAHNAELRECIKTAENLPDADNSTLARVIDRTVTELTAKDFEGVYTVGNNVFNGCVALENVVFSDDVARIRVSAFSGCYALKKVVFPKDLTQIFSAAFYRCTAMEEYDFSRCTSVPSLAAASAFTEIPSTCVMKIPSALFDEWKATTNWSEYADYMVAV